MQNQVKEQRKQLIQSKMAKKLMELEGQCKIQATIFLRINWLKSILLIIPLTLCVIPLFLIAYYKWFRVLVFYSQENFLNANHIYVKSKDGLQEIKNIYVQQNQLRTFNFKKLAYRIISEFQFVPIGYKYLLDHKKILSKNILASGLSQSQVQKSERQFGKNQHNVDIQSYPSYLFTIMIEPFFILQYVTSTIYMLEGFFLFAILMIVASFITTTINYILLYIAFKKIKQMAEHRFAVEVIRQKTLVKLFNSQLVPGDVYKLGKQVPCDSIMLKGESYLNQASLTGQSVPIGKFAAQTLEQFQQNNRWLYQGSKVMLISDESYAMAINTGYKSRRGRIIRKILNRSSTQPELLKTLFRFLFVTLLVGSILFFATLPFLLTKQIETIMVIFRYFDFVTYSFPAPFPIYFNIAYSFCSVRLKYKDVFGTQPQKTVQSAHLKTLCFDKTGTLTENKVSMQSIYSFQSYLTYQNIEPGQVRKGEMYYKIFASCHGVKLIQNNLMGDQIDIRMFQYTRAQINPENQNILYSQNRQEQFEILRLNQYQSKFQSMSVLVKIKGEYFIFIKGAPQKIYDHSVKKYEYFNSLLKQLSLKGFRSIAFGYRKVKKQQVQHLNNCDRQQFLENTTTIGIVAFENYLKKETQQAIKLVLKSNIQPKMITGDNLYIAIQTASRAGILSNIQQVLMLQGKKQNLESIRNGIYIGNILKRAQNKLLNQTNIQIMIQKQYKTQNLSIAVDNDFLMLQQKPFLVDKIRVFARISPQNKAYIVKTLKQQIQLQYDQRPKTTKIFGNMKRKVGMVGDGANDLIAIRQADVGIGFCDTDASYGSSFTIQNLSSINLIIRESKNVESQIIEMVRYYGLNSFLRLGLTILLTDDSTYFTSNQLTYNALAASIFITLLMALTRPSQTTTKYSPCSNFLGIQNNLVYWGQIIIFIMGITIGYIVFKNTDNFVSNSKPIISFENGYNGVTTSTSSVWLMSFWAYLSIPIIIYKSQPWKEQIYKNILLSIVIGLNTIFVLGMYFANKYMGSFLDIVQIYLKQAGILLGIMALTMFVSLSYNQLVSSLKLHEIQFEVNSSIRESQLQGQ